MLPRRRAPRNEGFTLIELMVATTVLVVVMAAVAPLFFGSMRLTGVTDQRSQATNLAVAATEQMRSLPYNEVGFYSTPGACAAGGAAPVSLTAAGPLDTLPTSTVVGGTTYAIVRCVYWSASSLPGVAQAYKQTVVKVSWAAPGGSLTVSQTSALYPGGPSPYTPPTPNYADQVGSPTCNGALVVGTDPPSIEVLWSPASVGEPASYFVAYYTTFDPSGAITSSGNPYTTASHLSGTSYTATVGTGATYYFQVAAVGANGSVSAPSGTCSATSGSGTVTVTTHPSAGSATSVALALGGGTVAYSAPTPTETASNDGSQPDQVARATTAVSVPGADSFLSVTAAAEVAGADQVGTSYACSGVLSTGQSLTGGSPAAPCSVSGTGSGGISLDLMGLPGVGSAVSSLVGGLTLDLSGATAWATDGAGGASPTGTSTLTGASIEVTPLGGLIPVQNLPLNLAATLTSPTDVVAAITAAIAGDPLIASIATPLQTALAPVLVLTGAYQTPGSGDFSISALHIAVLSGTGTADLASVTVGHNTTVTTTTTPPCRIYSLDVSPGSDGAPVALTSTGTLADESSFDLVVNLGPGCSNIEVGYAPSGCTPGASGCDTDYAAVTGTAGSYYGTAGSGSTVWSVGPTAFSVFTDPGGTPELYSPLIQQNVMLCSEQGTSGQC